MSGFIFDFQYAFGRGELIFSFNCSVFRPMAVIKEMTRLILHEYISYLISHISLIEL